MIVWGTALFTIISLILIIELDNFYKSPRAPPTYHHDLEALPNYHHYFDLNYYELFYEHTAPFYEHTAPLDPVCFWFFDFLILIKIMASWLYLF